MKRIKFIGFMAVIALLIGIAFSCEKEPPVPACEQNKVGSVLVENETGYTGEFDVTWGDVVENYEKTIYDGGSYLYNNIPATGHPESYNGKIEVWVRLTVGGGVWTDWVFNVEYLSPCEDMTYRWYLSASKSTEMRVFVDISRNGVLVETVEAVRAENGKVKE